LLKLLFAAAVRQAGSGHGREVDGREPPEHVMRERLKKSFSPARLASETMEVQALIRDAPRQLSDILGLLAENRLQVRMTGLDDSQLMQNVQKIANRISTGIIVAALILASAMPMRMEGVPGATRGPR
jgi:hypothetical protein